MQLIFIIKKFICTLIVTPYLPIFLINKHIPLLILFITPSMEAISMKAALEIIARISCIRKAC